MSLARSLSPALLAPLALLLAAVLTVPDALADSMGAAAEGAREPLAAVDRVVVRKAERRMHLYRANQVVRSYRVSLGLVPDGAKEHEGDYRTPEGLYYLTRRNPESDFFLSVQVSYPNSDDLAEARSRRLRPGGSIMVHGLPNVLKYPRDRYLQNDWTDGCIALSNDDMLEFWLLTQNNTPIEILP
jgi:murein L,D-transpeptidase YafK